MQTSKRRRREGSLLALGLRAAGCGDDRRLRFLVSLPPACSIDCLFVRSIGKKKQQQRGPPCLHSFEVRSMRTWSLSIHLGKRTIRSSSSSFAPAASGYLSSVCVGGGSPFVLSSFNQSRTGGGDCRARAARQAGVNLAKGLHQPGPAPARSEHTIIIIPSIPRFDASIARRAAAGVCDSLSALFAWLGMPLPWHFAGGGSRQGVWRVVVVLAAGWGCFLAGGGGGGGASDAWKDNPTLSNCQLIPLVDRSHHGGLTPKRWIHWLGP